MSRERVAGSTLVIGLGNRFRSDDGVGAAALDRIHQLCPTTPTVEASGEATGLLDLWHDLELAIVLDATRSGSPAGTVHRWALAAGAPASELGAMGGATSSHAAGLAEAWALGAALDQNPERLVVFGIEGADFEPGIQLSPAVAAAVPRVARAVRAELSRARRPHQAGAG